MHLAFSASDGISVAGLNGAQLSFPVELLCYRVDARQIGAHLDKARLDGVPKIILGSPNKDVTNRRPFKQVSEHIWLVSFMDYDLGYFDHETCKLEPLDNPFGPKVLPMSPE